MERKQKLECEVQRHTVYEDIMEQIVKMTKVGYSIFMWQRNVTKFIHQTICQLKVFLKRIGPPNMSTPNQISYSFQTITHNSSF